MARKHVKVEPDRWYYWCDKLGLLVWQDMPSGDKHVAPGKGEITRTQGIRRELRARADGADQRRTTTIPPSSCGSPSTKAGASLRPSASPIGQGLDPDAPGRHASGWNDFPAGDVHDIHVYPGPAAPPKITARPSLANLADSACRSTGHLLERKRQLGLSPPRRRRLGSPSLRNAHPISSAC